MNGFNLDNFQEVIYWSREKYCGLSLYEYLQKHPHTFIGTPLYLCYCWFNQHMFSVKDLGISWAKYTFNNSYDYCYSHNEIFYHLPPTNKEYQLIKSIVKPFLNKMISSKPDKYFDIGIEMIITLNIDLFLYLFSSYYNFENVQKQAEFLKHEQLEIMKNFNGNLDFMLKIENLVRYHLEEAYHKTHVNNCSERIEL